MTEQTARAPLLRSPFLWAFLVSIAVITLIRPCLRRVPEPPPVSGRFPDLVLEDRDGQRFDRGTMLGTVWIVALLRDGCGEPCDAAPRRLGDIAGMYSDLQVKGIRLVRVVEGIAGGGAANAAGGPSNLIEVSGDGGAIRGLTEVLTGAGAPSGPGRLAIVDAGGN